MSDHFYTASEAQDILGISKGMFFRKVQEGLIPKIILPGMKQGVYPKRDIDAIAKSMNMLFEQYDKIVFSKSTPADQLEEMNIEVRFHLSLPQGRWSCRRVYFDVPLLRKLS